MKTSSLPDEALVASCDECGGTRGPLISHNGGETHTHPDLRLCIRTLRLALATAGERLCDVIAELEKNR